MAFRILTDKETERLNAAEKAAYETELAEYRKRAAFVERLEKQADIKMPEVHPTKIRVRKFRNADLKSPELRKAPAVSRFSSDKLSKSLAAYKNIRTDFSLDPVKMSALPSVSVPSPLNSKRSFSSFSVTSARKIPVPDAKSISFKHDDFSVELPENIKSLSAPDVNVNIPENAGSVKNLPGVCIPSAGSVSVNIPPVSLNSLPAVNAAAPDTVKPDIPEYTVRNTQVRTAVPDNVAFKAPAAPNAAVTAVNVRTPEIRSFAAPAAAVADIPHVVADAPVVSVSVPPVGNVSVSAVTVNAPAVHGTGLEGAPKINKVHCFVAECPDLSSIRLNVKRSPQLNDVSVTVPDAVAFTPPEPVTVSKTAVRTASAPVIDKDALIGKFMSLSGGINEK